MNADEPRFNEGSCRGNDAIAPYRFDRATPRSSAFICGFIRRSLRFCLGGCAVGPNYSKPDVEVPAQYKEAGDWVVAQPKDAAPKGKWWEAFNDPVLNALDGAGRGLQPDPRARPRRAIARRARRCSRRARQFFPTLGAERRRVATRRNECTSDRYTVTLDARWEVDLWGRIRRLVEASRAGEEASAADLENARALAAGGARDQLLPAARDRRRSATCSTTS